MQHQGKGAFWNEYLWCIHHILDLSPNYVMVLSFIKHMIYVSWVYV